MNVSTLEGVDANIIIALTVACPYHCYLMRFLLTFDNILASFWHLCDGFHFRINGQSKCKKCERQTGQVSHTPFGNNSATHSCCILMEGIRMLLNRCFLDAQSKSGYLNLRRNVLFLTGKSLLFLRILSISIFSYKWTTTCLMNTKKLKELLVNFKLPLYITARNVWLLSTSCPGGYSRFQVTEMIKWGQKWKPPKN